MGVLAMKRANTGCDGLAETDCSRRRFLGLAAGAAGSVLLPRSQAALAGTASSLPPGQRPSRVVRMQSGHVVTGSHVHRMLFAEMLDRSLLALTDQMTVRDAWRTILRADDVIGLKFNRSGQETIGTTPAVAEAIIASLTSSGWNAEKVVCIEAPPELVSKHGTLPAAEGYQAQETDFVSGVDQFASVLDQVTAIIDVPYLKTHNIAGLSGALKNLSHGLIKHPARFHRNGCSPYVADIVAAPPIRSKLRLCIVDGLRAVFEGGPEATSERLGDEGLLLLSRDPVAVDAVGFSELNSVRSRRGMTAIGSDKGPLPYLQRAHEIGLGMAAWHGVEVRSIQP